MYGNKIANVFRLTTFPSQTNMDSTLTDDAPLVKIVKALNFSKNIVVLMHKLIHVIHNTSLAAASR